MDALVFYMEEHHTPYPPLPPPLGEGEAAKDDESITPAQAHDMYVGMFRTALEMIAAEEEENK
jgi:hypothetical protein